jgi:hypothetical protein
MSFDNDRKLLLGSSELTVFRRVELTDLSKLELLDEAIILKPVQISPKSNEISPGHDMSDQTGLDRPDKTIEKSSLAPDVERFGRKEGGFKPIESMIPVPLIPMSMVLVALILAVLWTSV